MQRVETLDWITVDDAYADQLAAKAALIQTHGDGVLICLPQAQDAVREVLEEVLNLLEARPDFEISDKNAKRPDGVMVPINRDLPLQTLSRLIQEDICILQKDGDQHRLTAALLCFPASWTLGEKIGRDLGAIHTPVEEYSDDVARRVRRLFDGVRVGQPMWRANLLRYDSAELYHPRSENDPREAPAHGDFERSERQTLFRLPISGAVVFAIHTTLAPLK